MGDNLPEINLGVPYVATDVTVGDGFVCAAVTGSRWNCDNPPCSEGGDDPFRPPDGGDPGHHTDPDHHTDHDDPADPGQRPVVPDQPGAPGLGKVASLMQPAPGCRCRRADTGGGGLP